MERANSTNFSDPEIIEHLRQGDSDRRRSEEQLFNRFSYFIREGMNKHGLSEDDAFSAYADTILSGIDKISSRQFEGRSSLKTYLFQIFHNKCVDLIRKRTTHKGSVHRTETVTDMLAYISDSAKSVVQQMIDKTDWSLLKERLNALGESCQKLLGLWAENYPDKQIAALLQYKTADVVKTSRLRCLEKLRQLYKQT